MSGNPFILTAIITAGYLLRGLLAIAEMRRRGFPVRALRPAGNPEAPASCPPATAPPRPGPPMRSLPPPACHHRNICDCPDEP